MLGSPVQPTGERRLPEIAMGDSQSVGVNRLFFLSRPAGHHSTPPSPSPRPDLLHPQTAAGLFGTFTATPSLKVFGICFFLWAFACPSSTFSWAQATAGKPATRETTDLKIQVRGGQESVPVKNASVYVEYRQGRFLVGKKKYKYGVKTNNDGVASVREVPKGKILIQVVAVGWKTFGKVYEIEDDEATVEILLQRPMKWY